MADFSLDEKLNAAFKLVFDRLGTSNTSDATGKRVFEEKYSSKSTILPRLAMADAGGIPYCALLADARAAAMNLPTVIEDFSIVPTILTLDMTSNGRLWLAREVPGEEDSALLAPFLDPADYPNVAGEPSNGFALRLVDANGVEISPTVGAWSVRYSLGAIILADGQTVGEGELAGCVSPLEAYWFRYIGRTGFGEGSMANLDGGRADEVYGGVGISPLDGGDATSF